MGAILWQEPKLASQITDGLPTKLESIIVRCLQKDREHRWQTMAEVKNALAELKEQLESKAFVAPQRNRFRGLIWAAVVLVILAVAGDVVWFNRSTSQVPEGEPTVAPFTSYPGHESEPSFSSYGN